MSDMPKKVTINEEGPREGFQMNEKGLERARATGKLMGIDTGIDLDQMIECAQLAEDIVGHPLPRSVKMGGNLIKLRAAAAQA